jgi:hypothetical protein
MGKRELLIIGAFLIVGACAYYLTAPAPKPGERSFSISEIFGNIKREISAHSATAKVTRTDTIAVPPTITELRVSTGRAVGVTIIGEERTDIGYEMPIESSGPDEATALAWANKVKVTTDDLGTALGVGTYFPEEGSQRATLTLKVPARLHVRIENSGRINASKIAALELRNLSGETVISGIAGGVTGSHRSGEISITGAGLVNLTLVGSRARIRDAADGVTVNARSGECWIDGVSGPVVATITNAEITIAASKHPVKVSGEGGRVKVGGAKKLSIDARRMVVEVDTAEGGIDEVTIITSDEPLRLSIGGGAAMKIDAVATHGANIRAGDFGVQPTVDGTTSRLETAIGAGGARVVLRNSRGDIVIGKRK